MLHVVPTYRPAWRYGGTIYSVHGLCRALAVRGNSVSVYTTNVDGDLNMDVPLGRAVGVEGVRVWYFPVSFPRRLYRSPALRSALMRDFAGFDVVHLHSIFLWPTYVAARLARAGGVPYVVSPRGMLIKDLFKRRSRWAKNLWIHAFERRTLQQASAIHFTSQLEANEVAKFGFNLPAGLIIPNGVSVEEWGPDATGQSTAESVMGDYLLFLGRINWKKGLDRLIRSLEQIPNHRLVIAGHDDEGYRAELETIVAELGIEHRVRFTGSVSGVDKRTLLRGASVLILPSYSENMGNVVLEAMASGVPVVVTPEVGAAEIVRKYGCGRVVDGEPKSLARGITELMADARRRREMGEAGRRAAETELSWGQVAALMEEFYWGVIREARAA